MENKKETSPFVIAAGIVGVVVITLAVLGLIAFSQRPTEQAVTGEVAAVASATPTTATVPTESPTPAEQPTNTPSIDATPTPVPLLDTKNITATEAKPTAVQATTGGSATTAVTSTAASVMTATTDVAAINITTTTTTSAPASVVTTTVTKTESTAAAAAPVDMAAVTAAVTKGTCGACHTIPGIAIAVGQIGPNLSAIGKDAATRIQGYTAEAYIRESIQKPNAFIAPKCPTGPCQPNIMLPNLVDILTPAEIDTIVNYLLTLQGQ